MNRPQSMPVQSLLASSILQAEGQERLKRKGNAVSAVWDEVDRTLDGFRFGEVTGVSCERDEGLVLHVLAAHLQDDTANTAIHIDTTGAFDVGRFYVQLVDRIQQRNSIRAGQNQPSNFEDEALAILSRLKLMRVFDFDGLVEALSEISDTLNERPGSANERKEVPDSQEEEGDMLFDLVKQREEKDEARVQEKGKCLLIVNTISQVASPLLRSDYVQAQAFLTSTMRTLTHLTYNHSLCTILVNATVPLRSAKTSTKATAGKSVETDASAVRSPSVFASTPIRPALGTSFTRLLDTHLFVTFQPLSKKDARLVQAKRLDEAEVVPVIEVLADRYGNRVGRWCVLGDG